MSSSDPRTSAALSASFAQAPPAELSVIVPTFNERENVPLLVKRLTRTLAGISWEAIFVDDDSPDGTAALVRALARERPQIRCVQRIGRRGLASACVEGALASSAPFIAIMDADLQHDEALLPIMLAELRTAALDIVIASRFIEGSDAGSMPSSRLKISDWGGRLARLVVKAELEDPMSGFFMLRRPVFEAAAHNLSAQGFKILLDVFASSPRPLAYKELPFRFRARQHGTSKLDALVSLEYLFLLIDKLVGRVIPIRFLMFATIGGLGLFVHLAALALALKLLPLSFVAAQAMATATAMTSNFFLNNVLTYRDRQLRGRALLRGLLAFYAVCGVGAVANVGVASFVFGSNQSWWLAGIAGALVGAVWNYAASSLFSWR